MDDHVQVSCWKVATKAIACIAAVMIIGWLFMGAEVSTLIVSR